MFIDQPPTEIIEEGKYWLYTQEVTDCPRIAGDGYFSKHDVTRPEELTSEDFPPTDDNAVRKIDREALDEENVIGKWHVTGSAERIEHLWPDIVDDTTEQIIWGAKATTGTGYEEHPGDDHMIVVYTPNYFEKHDVDRVRKHLRDEYGITRELFYKPDIYSAKGIQPDTAEEWGLSMAYRYRA